MVTTVGRPMESAEDEPDIPRGMFMPVRDVDTPVNSLFSPMLLGSGQRH